MIVSGAQTNSTLPLDGAKYVPQAERVTNEEVPYHHKLKGSTRHFTKASGLPNFMAPTFRTILNQLDGPDARGKPAGTKSKQPGSGAHSPTGPPPKGAESNLNKGIHRSQTIGMDFKAKNKTHSQSPNKMMKELATPLSIRESGSKDETIINA